MKKKGTVTKRMAPKCMEEQKVIGRVVQDAREQGNYLAEEKEVV